MTMGSNKKSGEHFYIKFHYNDILSSTSLRECDVVGSGVYLFIFCMLCKTKPKGRYEIKVDYIGDLLQHLPRQNIQQSNQQIVQHLPELCRTLAEHFVKHLPFSEKVIASGLKELLENDVLYIEGNFLCQKRLLRESEISAKRSIAGAAGAKKTNSKKSKNAGSEEIFDENLSDSLPQQNHQQNPNYNYSYNSNYNSNEDNKGGIDNSVGGVGVEISGGEEGEKDHYAGNWHLATTPENCKKYYFSYPDFEIARNEALKKLYTYFSPDDQTLLIERLQEWADSFNAYIHRTTEKKPMRGHDCWPDHFFNWLNKQGVKLKNPPSMKDKPIKNDNAMSGNASLEAQKDRYRIPNRTSA